MLLGIFGVVFMALIVVGLAIYVEDFKSFLIHFLLPYLGLWGGFVVVCLLISVLYVLIFGPVLKLVARLSGRKRKDDISKMSFTLLELLIVIGIIGLLAAMLFPVLGKVRERGWQSRCLSNLHQLGVAVNLYAQDNSHYLPVAAMQPTVNTNLPSISSLLAPHVGQQQSKVFACPADRQPLDGGQTFYAAEGCSYSWNSLLNGRLIDRAQIDIAAMKLWPPILGDYEKFHGGGDSARNYLYPDGRVENDLKALIQ